MIAGAACKYNRTMSFLAMDSNAYGVYAERLGINLHEMHVKTAAVILDSEVSAEEILTQYVHCTIYTRLTSSQIDC